MSPPRSPRRASVGRATSRRGQGATGRPAGSSALGGEQIEGTRAVLELLRAARREVREIWVARGDARGDVSDEAPDGARPDPAAEIVHLADAAGVPVQVVDRTALHHAAVTDAPQGVVAWAEPLEEATLDELCSVGPAATPGSTISSGPGTAPFLVVLEGITDPRNTGAIARSALSAGASGMILPRHRGAHVTPAATKSAAGAFEYLRVAIEPGIPAALTRLAEREIWSVGLDPEADVSIFEVTVLTGAVALVLGAEGRGLSRLAAKRCDLTATIPQQGPLGSLNVAAAGAVACFEVARQRSGLG